MTTMQQKLSYILTELAAFEQTYKAEIAEVRSTGHATTCKEDIGEAINALENAMYEINHQDEAEEEEHANSSRANSRDYQAEENATTGRE